jgi:hypothetical protein
VTSANEEAIYAGSPGSPQIAARLGDVAPGTGLAYSQLFNPKLNDLGQIAFRATLDVNDLVPDDAIFAGSPGSVQLVARKGAAAPGMAAGVTYNFLSTDPTTNDAGQIAYVADLTGPGITGTNSRVMYLATIGSPTPVPVIAARRGDQAPGAPTGVRYNNFLRAPSINDAGGIAFVSELFGTGVTTSNLRAIFAGSPLTTPSGVQMLARDGQAAPGTPAGVTFSGLGGSQLDQVAINNRGQIVFSAGLVGTGVTTANGSGLFAYDPAAGIRLILRRGDPFDVGGGDLRTISSIGFNYGVGDDVPTGLGSDGRLAYLLTFTDGSTGVSTSAIPEPGAAGVLSAFAAASLAARRRRRTAAIDR